MPILVDNVSYSDKQNDMFALMEAYYGKSKELIEAEKICGIVVDSVMKQFGTFEIGSREHLIDGKDINFTPQVKKLEELLAKAIGIRSVNITFLDPLLSGGTFGATSNPSSITRYIKGPSKTFSRGDIHAVVAVDKALIYRFRLTAGELMAVILHELGHCVDDSLFALIAQYAPSFDVFDEAKGQRIWAYVGQVMGTVFGGEIRRSLKPALDKIWATITSHIPTLSRVYLEIKQLGLTLGLPKRLITRLTTASRRSIADYLNPEHIFGYAGEKHADSFATAYGYGPETVSFQAKFQKTFELRSTLIPNDGPKKFPWLTTMFDIGSLMYKISSFMIDEHPDGAIRLYSQIRKAKRDLNSQSIHPKLKKELEMQIAEMEKIAEDMTSFEGTNKHKVFTVLWNKLMIDVFKGYGDPRELLELIWNHDE